MAKMSTFGIFRGRNVRGRNVLAEMSMAKTSMAEISYIRLNVSVRKFRIIMVIDVEVCIKVSFSTGMILASVIIFQQAAYIFRHLQDFKS